MQKKLNNLAKRILKILHRENAALDIFLLPHAEIKELKARFIKKQTEPNVLSFPEPLGFPHPERRQVTSDKRQGRNVSLLSSRRRPGSTLPVRKYLGEIYLNKDILRKSPDRAASLLLHGILHLLGYDHMEKKDALGMEQMEAGVLKSLERTAK
jgi:rRNA maturation RNase YbeY